jgi:hypothetical protein
MLRYVRKRTNEFHSRYGLVDCAAATKAYFEKQKYRIGPEPDGGNSEKIAAFSNDMIKAGTAFMDFEEVSAAAGSVTAAFEEFLADARFDEASRDRFFFPRYEAELSRMAVKLGDARVRVLDRWDERALDQKFAELLEADDQIESCLEELMKGEREHVVLAHDRRVTKIRYEQQIFDLFASSLPGDQVTAQTDKLRAEEDKKLGALDKQVTDHEKTRDAVREKIKKLVEKKIDFESLMPKEVQR